MRLREEKEEEERLEQDRIARRESSRQLVSTLRKQDMHEELNLDWSIIPNVDDTDGLDPTAEFDAWRLRELLRIKRTEEEREQADAERAELERRRNMTEEEKAKEDEALLKAQQEEKEGKHGKMAFMQKYYHKGAFFMVVYHF